ncbi:IclR family transcriptional regulator [Streptomyces mirabilis]
MAAPDDGLRRGGQPLRPRVRRRAQPGAWLGRGTCSARPLRTGPTSARSRTHGSRHLAEETGESAIFSAVRGDETVCLLREDGAFPIRSHVLYEGVRFPLGVVSAGIAVLAFLPDREIDQFLATHDLTETYGQTHAEPEIRRRLEKTRQCGWSLNAGHIVPGSWGMAATVFGPGERPVGALTLTGIETRMGAERQPALGALLLKSAHTLSSELQRSRKMKER